MASTVASTDCDLPVARQQGFPPVLGDQPLVLVLGSMPSLASLREGRYYGHPRNAFWPIMAALFDWPADLPYSRLCLRLCAARVALWDVIAACHREGSADAAIDRGSIRINPIPELLLSQPSIRAIAFNGDTARREFERRILPVLDADRRALTRYRLPSTSPAMARLSLAEKTLAWRTLLQPLGRTDQ